MPLLVNFTSIVESKKSQLLYLCTLTPSDSSYSVSFAVTTDQPHRFIMAPFHSTAFVPNHRHLGLTQPSTSNINVLPQSPNMMWSESLSPLSSSHLIAAVTTTTDVATPTTQVFEAVAPDTSLLIGMGSVVILCIIAGAVWANEVVPASRTKLAISKSRGEVREYLDGLKSTDDAVGGESMNGSDTTTTTTADEQQKVLEKGAMVKPNVGDGRDFERWLFSDWLNKPSGKGGRQKEPALPILKEAKWNSGDNPVLVTAGIMLLGVVLASITERIST